jgi:peptidyl-tRNA hydrolase
MAETDSPLALQMAARVEKIDPPLVDDILAAAARSVIELLDDERSGPAGEWYDEVAAWNGARIRKIMRRGRASAWGRAQSVAGVTVRVGTAEVRAFVPGPLDQAPRDLAKLQIQSTPLDEPELVTERPDIEPAVLVIAVTPHVEMSWGKLAAQCAHAGQRAWERATPTRREAWRARGSVIRVVHPDAALWDEVRSGPVEEIRDGGFTEIPAGTLTAIGWIQVATEEISRLSE